MTKQLKRLLIACHPDRHGGDHSRMEDFFAVANQSRAGLVKNPHRCQFPGCGVAVTPHSRACRAHWRALRRTAITAAFLLMATVAQAASWYVSMSVGSSGNGQTWGTAWKDTTDIVWGSVAAGDTVYLDGGASGLSYAAFNNITADGTSESPITIAASTESGRNGIVTIATPFVVSGDYIRFQGNGYKLVSGTTYRCGIVFTCSDYDVVPVSYTGGQSINCVGLFPRFDFCYFNGTYGGDDTGSSLGFRGTSGMTLVNCWFYQSVGEDQMTWEMTSPGGVFCFTNVIWQDNNKPDRSDASHRDIVNTWTGSSGYDLYVVGCMSLVTPGHADDAPQGDGFLLQDSYYGTVAQLGNVFFHNNVAANGARFLAFGTDNSGADKVEYFNNTVFKCTEADGFQVNSPTTGKFLDVTQDNIITTSSGMNMINTASPLGADGIPFTDDDGFMIQSGSSAIDAGASVGVTTDIRGYDRTGTPDDGAYEFGATGGGDPPVDPPAGKTITITGNATAASLTITP